MSLTSLAERVKSGTPQRSGASRFEGTEPDGQFIAERDVLRALRDEVREQVKASPDTRAAAVMAAGLAQPFLTRMDSGELTRDQVADSLKALRHLVAKITVKEQDEPAS